VCVRACADAGHIFFRGGCRLIVIRTTVINYFLPPWRRSVNLTQTRLRLERASISGAARARARALHPRYICVVSARVVYFRRKSRSRTSEIHEDSRADTGAARRYCRRRTEIS